ncbi:hypothetical protein [Methylocella sp.]|uniref:hypothetical protein n=1 Tax=Methylocella sp. TaxID=1978226 RepID=UPI0035B329E5
MSPWLKPPRQREEGERGRDGLGRHAVKAGEIFGPGVHIGDGGASEAAEGGQRVAFGAPGVFEFRGGLVDA